TITVPTAALLSFGQMEKIFIVTKGVARLRLVQSGAKITEKTEILSGLQAGEVVVVKGNRQLVDGQPVIVE
ncbi:MAG: efflux RND transporter periplasmic adaptor subunit, partial [Desulfoprunum sp.]|nr:efflux RND transporter periplasmic adaptor subunit [Desulfoprunum sp.]